MLRRLRLLGILTLGALARLPRPAVLRQFGADAGFYHDLAAGRDPRPVLPEAPPLELTATHTWEPPVLWQEALTIQIERLSAQLAERLIRRGHQAQGVNSGCASWKRFTLTNAPGQRRSICG
jgi:nucleotidyltransferase/DNA polymerase involved in DNA repair